MNGSAVLLLKSAHLASHSYCNSIEVIAAIPLLSYMLDVEALCRLGRRGEGLVPHGPEVALEVGHPEKGQQREGHQVQQGRLGRLEYLQAGE